MSCENDDIRAQLRQEEVVGQVGRKREVWKKQIANWMSGMAITGSQPIGPSDFPQSCSALCPWSSLVQGSSTSNPSQTHIAQPCDRVQSPLQTQFETQYSSPHQCTHIYIHQQTDGCMATLPVVSKPDSDVVKPTEFTSKERVCTHCYLCISVQILCT